MVRILIVFAYLILSGVSAGFTFAQSSTAPITGKELDKFIKDAPHIPDATGSALPSDSGELRAGADQAATQEKLKSLGWKPERFYAVYTKVSAVLQQEKTKELVQFASPQLAEFMKMIQDNPALDKATKEKLMRDMAGEMAQSNAEIQKADADLSALTNARVNAEERELILARRDKLESLIQMQMSPASGAPGK